MRRIIALILAMLFPLALTSCAGIGDGAIYGNDSLRGDILGEPLSADGWTYCYLGKSAGVISSMFYPTHSLKTEDALAFYALLKRGDFSASAELIDDGKMMKSTGYFFEFTDSELILTYATLGVYASPWEIYSGDIVVDPEGKQAIIEGIYDMAEKLYEASEAATLAQEESYVIQCPPNISEEINWDTGCFVSTYTGEGEQLMSMECSPAMEAELRELLDEVSYATVFIDYRKLPSYIEVELPAKEEKPASTYRVYVGDDVRKDGKTMGVLDGAYDEICDIVGISTGSRDEVASSWYVRLDLILRGETTMYCNVIRGYEAEDIYEQITENTKFEPVSAPYTLPEEHVRVDFEVSTPGEETRNIRYEVYSNGIVRRVYPEFGDEMTEVLGKNKELYGKMKDLSAALVWETMPPTVD